MSEGNWEQARDAVHSWVAGAMSQYAQRVQPTAFHAARSSVINDSVWGSIRLTPLERALVDSPLLQRLRRIKQLGPAQAVYPSARHTRFEHSLGSLHRAATVMDALVASGRTAMEGSLLVGADQIAPWTEAVRIAALFHDSGHVFLSHAGERVLTVHGCPGISGNVRQLLAGFKESFDCEKPPQLAEFFSHCILTSNELVNICDSFGLALVGRPDLRARQLLQILAGALVHSRSVVSEHDRWLADVLSGPLDVDKQDYVPRDALMAGVGVQVEPHRCAQVLRVCDFRYARVLNEDPSRITKGERRLTITFAGISVLEDLLLSRMSLFLRVYKHQKVRLVERLAERVFALLLDIDELNLLTMDAGLEGIMSLTDSVFYDGELLRRVRSRLNAVGNAADSAEDAEAAGGVTQAKKETLRVVEALARMLHERDYPVRAFAYGKVFPRADRNAVRDRQVPDNDAWTALMVDAIKVEKRTSIETKVVEIALQLAAEAGMPASKDDEALLRAAVCLDLPTATTVDLTPVYVYAHAHSQDLISYEQLFQPSQWLDALQDSKIICYVHAPRSWAHVVHAAAELFLAREYGAMAQHLRRAYSRCSDSDLRALKEKLCAKLGTSRQSQPIEGLQLILQHPSFIRQRDLSALQQFGDGSEPDDPEQEGRFHRINFKDKDAEIVCLHLDLAGSSKFCAVLEAKGAGNEAQIREALLLELMREVLRTVRDDSFGLLPLKTEGDALVAVVALAATSTGGTTPMARLVELALDLRETRWPEAMHVLAEAKSWKGDRVSQPGLRVTISRGDVEYKPQLSDVLGKAVTAMFVLEPTLKAWPKNTGVVVLGDSSSIHPDVISATKTLKHEKIEGVAAFAIARGAKPKKSNTKTKKIGASGPS